MGQEEVDTFLEITTIGMGANISLITMSKQK